MRIGIISINNAYNFGTNMQVYAFKEYLTSLGHEVQIIDHKVPKIEEPYILYIPKPQRNLLAKACWNLCNIWMMLIRPYCMDYRNAYIEFKKNYGNMTPVISSVKELRNRNYDFDVVFAGSDQVWNREITGRLAPEFFCDFLGPDTIRASYAASIGRDKLTEGEQAVFRRYLLDMDYVSVREEKARNLIQNLTENEIAVCLDPTLVADPKIFSKLLKKPRFKGDYIYVHSSSYAEKEEKLARAAEELSKRTHLPVVHNLQRAKFSHERGKTHWMGPEDILTTIANAKLIITQSFYVTAFSLIFHKNFGYSVKSQLPRRACT